MKHFMFAAFLGLATSISVSSHASNDKIGVRSDHPSLSPSGTEFVFSANFDGPPSRLWISGLNGSKLRKISTVSAADTEPAWSPDGRQIAFASTNGAVTDIWMVQADGTVPMKITANGANNSRPAWSPDGEKIAFVSDKGGSNDIWVMNADGTQQTRVTTSFGQENDPSFSPAGDKIVFSETANDAATLKIVNANGSGLRSLTTAKQNVHDWAPQWGVNGIVFSSDRDAPSEDSRIWTIQPDGTGLRKMANFIGYDPTWMPDGRILFTDLSITSNALSAVSILNPATGAKQIVVDIQGFLAPIDIRPGKNHNRINPNSKGRLEVAILSSRTFDVFKAVDQSTITFGRTGDEKSLVRCSKKLKDVNRDGLPDLHCRFALSNTGFRPGDTTGILRFQNPNGIPYEGREAITTVAEDDVDDLKNED